MKKLIIVLIVGLVVAGIAIAQPLRPMKWQDFLAKPSHEWLAKFGYNDGSQLAYHVTLLMENDRKLNEKIVQLESQIVELRSALADPNTKTVDIGES